MRARHEPDRDRAKGRQAQQVRPAESADTVQRAALAGRGPLTAGQALALQRAAGNAATAGIIERDGHQHDAGCGHAPPVQRSAVHEVLNSPGRPFTGPLASEVESMYDGMDLSHLRVHTDTVAQRSAADIGARAYTSGNHMVLGADSTTEDVVHEVWHTFQQSKGPVSGKDNGEGVKISEVHSPEEQEAAAVARDLVSRPVRTDPEAGAVTPGVQRSPAVGGQPSLRETSVQRAPSSTHSATSQQSAQPTYTFADTMAPNPSLYTDFANYWIGTANPPDGYFRIEQHCAYMSVHWLLNGHGSGGLRFQDFDEPTRLHAAATVRQWASEGGANAQVQYAGSRLGGHSVTGANLTSDATSGTLPVGTLIWFGNSVHAEAAVVTGKGRFLMYDPNKGTAVARDAKGFAAYIASKDTFVVRLGPGAEPDSCKCCTVM
ncbi:DUF4157 domain-containing protein [Streptomyces phaeochromogenes]|uniref:eCIS core domain-containing protein n=1 Tax=Streptomyces phaeochromogenes TaxID=1923 RepID=UPI002E0DA9E0|nr:DUF4157 domain-containing protein [Streptomyces phaeochromogenes]